MSPKESAPDIDGPESLTDAADETQRLAEKTRNYGKRFVPLEEFPSKDPDPLERLLAKEEGGEEEEIVEPMPIDNSGQ